MSHYIVEKVNVYMDRNSHGIQRNNDVFQLLFRVVRQMNKYLIYNCGFQVFKHVLLRGYNRNSLHGLVCVYMIRQDQPCNFKAPFMIAKNSLQNRVCIFGCCNDQYFFTAVAAPIYFDKEFYNTCAQNALKLTNEINWDKDFAKLIEIEKEITKVK